MGANKLERFEMRVMKRSDIHGADYNPRKISDSSKKKLKRFLKKHGLWCPLSLNATTGNLVSGHQRLEIMDSILGPEYDLTVAVGEAEEDEEVKVNVFMNNPSAQGEWDTELLHEIKEIWPDLDFKLDLGFEIEELEILGIEVPTPDIEIPDGSISSPTSNDTEAFREAKKRGREEAKKQNADGNGHVYSHADFTLTFIFPDAESKRSLLEKLGQPTKASRLNSQVLLNLCNNM